MARSFTRIGDKFLRHRSCLNAQRQQDIPARATARALKIEAFSDELHVALEISPTGSGHSEWNLLQQQFDALADEESANADSIEEIFDMEFRRRFGELINQTREPSTQNRDIAPGAGDRFHGGFVTYTKEMKNAVLGISMKVLKQKGAVCSEVAEAMATAALKLTPADVAIAGTGVAGPEPDEDGNPVGLVFCSAARSNRRTVTVRHFFEDLSPDATIKATVEEALTLLEQCCQC